MRKAFIALALIAAPAAAKVPDRFVGDWEGEGATVEIDDKFVAAVRIHPDGSARIAYRGMVEGQAYDCTGVLAPLAKRANARVFREKIETGECIDNAQLTLTLNGATLRFAWAGEADKQRYTARAVLTRKEQLTS
jgi:hypothetical protein